MIILINVRISRGSLVKAMDLHQANHLPLLLVCVIGGDKKGIRCASKSPTLIHWYFDKHIRALSRKSATLTSDVDFQLKSPFISETVQDRLKVAMKR